MQLPIRSLHLSPFSLEAIARIRARQASRGKRNFASSYAKRRLKSRT